MEQNMETSISFGLHREYGKDPFRHSLLARGQRYSFCIWLMIELNTIGDGSHSELITSEHQTESNNEIKNPERSQKNDCASVSKEHEPCKKKKQSPKLWLGASELRPGRMDRRV